MFPEKSGLKRPRKAKALDVPLQNVVHAAGLIDFCEVGKLTVEGADGTGGGRVGGEPIKQNDYRIVW